MRYSILLFLRTLQRQKLFTVINLLGLTVSISVTILIYLHVRHEFSYDRFHHDVDRIYRINQTFIWGDNNTNQFASTGPGVAYAIKQDLPEAELITSVHTPGNFIVSYTNNSGKVISFEEDRILAADSNFFKMFNFKLVSGDPETVFDQANTMVITRSTAKKYFGNEDPIGKLIWLGSSGSPEQRTYEVTGVAEDTPDNSYIEFDLLLSMKSFPVERFYWSWVWTQLETYIRLDPKADVEHVRTKLATFPRKHAEQTLKLAFNQTFDEYINSGKKWELFMQPMTSIHLPPETVINRLNDSGNITVIKSFIGAAIFIVLLSCINFMNLSTAQFTRRLKEASVRKILGLSRRELSLSYFIEALTFCTMAMIMALGATQLLLPGFNLLTEKSLRMDLFHDGTLLLGLAGLMVLMSAFSGSYPAFFLSAFKPAEAIKGKIKIGKEGKSFRNGLVVFQFSVSIVLIICTSVVFQQLNFVSRKDLGFTKENLMVLRHVETVTAGESMTQEIASLPGVVTATWCSSVPPRIWGGDSFGVEGTDQRYPINFTSADHLYIPTLKINLKVGRNFLPDAQAEYDRVIVNESAIRKFGWEINETVLGKKLMYENGAFEIIGVVADFNYWSLANPIEPMAIFHIKTNRLYPEQKHYIAMSLETQNSDSWETTLDHIKSIWKAHATNAPFDYYFVDQAFAETFKSQQQFGKILTVMSGLAIMIAGLGLLGMIIYALEQRTKEIGIRKISGASTFNILILISKGYTQLILIAFVVGAPVSWWLMQQWLQDFSYHITPSPLLFILTGLTTLGVAVLITGYHSVKAALKNPIDVLKDE